jgi:hypothetical protein
MSQWERYLALRDQVQEKYDQLRPHLAESDLGPFWETGILKARTVVLPYPDFDFMGKPGLRGRMGTHPRKSVKMKAWLEENFDRRTTKKGLVVDDFGSTPLDSFLGHDVNDDVIKFLYYNTVFEKISGLPIKSFQSIIEWGGGYGAHAKLFWRMGHPKLTYTIADIPPVCALQWLYLSVLFGEETVNLITREDEEIVERKINILPSPLLLKRENPDSAGLFVSMNALNECPADIVREVVEGKDWFGAYHLLLRMGGRHHVLDKDSPTGYYDLRGRAESFGEENNPPIEPLDFPLIVRSR